MNFLKTKNLIMTRVSVSQVTMYCVFLFRNSKMEGISIVIFVIIVLAIYLYFGRSGNSSQSSSSKGNHGTRLYSDLSRAQNSTIFKMYGGGGTV